MAKRLAMLAAALLVAAVGLTVAARAQSGSSAPTASFDWKMAERYGLDADGDRVIDATTSAAFVNPSSWTVHLDACTPQQPATGLTYEWTVPTGAGPRIEKRQDDCKLTHAFPSLGTHTVSLKVSGSGGTATHSKTLELRDFLIVSMGDSAASGEGNPDWLEPSLSGTTFQTAGFTHKWGNEQCHRSALAGPAQAALRIEKRDPHSSVTFLHVACSGARITRGLLNTYQGIEPTKTNPPGQDPFDCDDPKLGNVTYGTPSDPACLPSQIDQVRSVLSGRSIDALLISAGINDLHFSSIVKACLFESNCRTDASSHLKLGVNGSGPDKTGQDFLAAKLQALPTLYDQLALEIRGKLPLATGRGKVYLSEYPDPSTDDAGGWCSTDDLMGLSDWPPYVQSGVGNLLGSTGGKISAAEWEWAKKGIVAELSSQIASAAGRNSTTSHPWVAVGKSTARFDKHGYCARDTWFHTIARSFLYQRDSEGSFHPNRAGHFYAYALPIEDELAKSQNLNITAPALPPDVPGEIELWESISQGLAPLFDVISRVDFAAELEKVLAYRPTSVTVDFGSAVKQAGTAISRQMKSLENLVQNTAVPKGLNALDHRLDDLDNDGDLKRDGSFSNGAFTLDVEGTITPHAPALQHELLLDVTLTGRLPASVKLDHKSLAIDTSTPQPIELKGRLRFLLGPHFPPKANRKDAFYLKSGSFKVSAAHQSELPASAPLAARYGILDVALRGPAGGKGIDLYGALDLSLKDPNVDGRVTWEEWSQSSLADLVSVKCDPASRANLDLTLSAGLSGLPTGDLATLKLADPNLCDGLTAPALTLIEPKLEGFSRLTPAEIVGAYQRLAAALRAMLKRDDVPLPFLKERLSHALDLGDRIVEFLKTEDLVDANDPLSQKPLTQAQQDKVATIEKATALLAKHLGLTASNPFNLRYDAQNERLLLDLKLQSTTSPSTVAQELDLGLLGRAGLLSITTTGKAQVKPSYDVDLGLGLDLTANPQDQLSGSHTLPASTLMVQGSTAGFLPEGHLLVDGSQVLRYTGKTATTFTGVTGGTGTFPDGTKVEQVKTVQDRLLVKTTGAKITADAEVKAKLDLDAQVGVLAVDATADDGNGGARSLLERKVTTNPMFSLALSGGTNGYATATDVFGTDPLKFGVTTGVNARVPKFPIAVTATAGTTTLASGKVEVEWPDVTAASGTNGPQVTVDADYDRKLLRFDFDRQNPRAVLNLVLTTLRDGMAQVERLARDSDKLARSLPVLGAGYDDMVATFAKVRTFTEQLIALNSSLTLQGLEQRLEAELKTAFGLTQAQAEALLGLRLDTSQPRTALIVKLDFCQAAAQGGACPAAAAPLSTPLLLNVPSNGIIGAGASGQVTLDYTARGVLELGVELPRLMAGTATDPAPKLASGESPASAFVTGASGVTLDVNGSLQGTIGAKLGPFGVSLGLPSDPASAKAAARFAVNTGGTATERLTPAAWATKVLNRLASTGFSIAPTTTCTVPGSSGQYHGCAKLPVFLEDAAGTISTADGKKWSKLGEITFTSTDLLSGGSFSGHQAVARELAKKALRFTTLVDGARWLVDRAKSALGGLPQGAELPLIGGKLSAGTEALTKLDEFLAKVGTIAVEVDKVAETAHAGTLEGKIETEVFNALGPNGLKLLRDVRAPSGVDAADVEATIRCGNRVCDPTAMPTSFTDVGLKFSIGQDPPAAATPLDLGFDGLQLKSADQLSADADWKLDVAIGIDRTGGFYVDAAAGQELTASAKVGLPQTMNGELAFLPITVTDSDPGVADLDATIAADLKGTRLYLKDVLAQGWSVTDRSKLAITAKGCADVNLALNVKVPGGGMPSLWTDLIAKADLGGGCPNSTSTTAWDVRDGLGAAAAKAAVELRNVEVDAGDVATSFIRPVAQDIQRYTQPLQPVITEIDKPIPIVNDLAKLAGKSGMTWYQAWAAGQQLSGNDVTLITTVKNLASWINSFPTVGSARIRVADVVGVDVAQAVKPPSTPEEAEKLINGSPVVKDVAAQLKTAGFDVDVQTAKVAAAGSSAKFEVPVVKKPMSLVQLLFGKDVDLVTFDAGALRASQPFDFSYGLPFAKVGVAGHAGVSGHLEVGYDTYGIRRVLRDKLAWSSLGSLVHGLYLNDLKDGEDVPEIRLDADMHLYASVGAPGLSAEAQGGVEGNVDVNLHDTRGEGKIRYEDVATKIMTPQCLFDTSGKISAYARVVISGGPFKGTKNIVSPYTLLEIPNIQQWCSTQQPAPPEPAELQSDGTLVLNMGARAAKRNIANGETDERFTVTEMGGGRVGVTILSAYKDYGTAANPVKKIKADGDSGADSVVLANAAGGDFTLPVVFDGGDGNDRLYGGSAGDTLSGGAHDDAIVGAGGDDTLNGGIGQDQIDGGRGGDTIDGGGDADTIEGDPLSDPVTPAADPATAVDTIRGGGGADQIWGSIGDDKLYGDDGDDTVHGDDGTDTIDGGNHHDDLFGDAASDTVTGGAGNDNLVGGPGNVKDTLDGGADRDYLLGDDGTITRTAASADSTLSPSRAFAGDDTLRGSAGDDVIHGQGGKDDVDGGLDNDVVNGGADDDALAGGGGADEVHGDHGVDAVRGGDGADRLHGGIDGDELWGEDGADRMFGDSGADKLHGGPSDDSIRGGAGDDVVEGEDATSGATPVQFLAGDGGQDRIVGGSGRDDISGGTEVDTIEAGPGADRGTGDEGEDVINGGEGDDAMSGGDDDDLIHGDGGNDELSGEGGQDRLIGGRNIGYYTDGDDRISGGDGRDLILGDNGTISAAGAMSSQPGGNGSYDDRISGGADRDVVRGQYGHDTLRGDGGQDELRGDHGDDTLDGGDGDDVLHGHVGRDTIAGGTGADYAIGDEGTVAPAASGPKVWPGGAPNYDVTLIDDGGDADALAGGPGDDHLYGGPRDDLLEGDEDDDYIEGNGGRDRVFGYDQADSEGGTRPGNDDLIGGGTVAGREDDVDLIGGSGGGDVIAGDNATIVRVLNAAGDAWELDAATHTPQRKVTLHDQGAQYPLGAPDTINAGAGADSVFGQIGGDTVSGGKGIDALVGDDGDDRLDGGTEPDRLFGAAGDDRLAGGGEDDDLDGAGGDDDLSGGGGDDHLHGGADHDALDGGAGFDALRGGDGDDRLTGGLDPDVLDGEAGADVAAYRGAPSGVAVSLTASVATGGDGDDRLANLEHVEGSEFDDALTGDARANRLFGFGGRDELRGEPGADVLSGGDGVDRLDGGAGDDGLNGGPEADVADYRAAPSGVAVSLAAGSATAANGNDSLALVENVDGSGFADHLSGDPGDNVLSGHGGDDRLQGEGRDDTLDGGAGTDMASYAAAPTGVEASLIGGWAIGGDGNDVLRGLEQLTGSIHDDILTGDAGPNRLVGSDGPDRLQGLDGADALLGDAGEDLLEGGDGDDRLRGGEDGDTEAGGPGADTFFQGPQRDGADIIAGDRPRFWSYWGNDPDWDVVSYATRCGAGVWVTNDAQPDDGEWWEGDNVMPDIDDWEPAACAVDAGP